MQPIDHAGLVSPDPYPASRWRARGLALCSALLLLLGVQGSAMGWESSEGRGEEEAPQEAGAPAGEAAEGEDAEEGGVVPPVVTGDGEAWSPLADPEGRGETPPDPAEPQGDAEDAVQLERGEGRVRIAGLELSCERRFCRDEVERDRLLRATGLRAGTEVSRAQVAEGVRVLVRLGHFREVRVRERAVDDGVVLVLEGEANRHLRKVRVRSSSAWADEVRRRVFLRSGQAWTDDEAVLERQREALIDWFERRGFFGTEVVFDVRDLDEGRVDIDIRLRIGSRLRVDRIFVRGHEVLRYEEVRDALLGAFNFFGAFNGEDFQEATEAVIRMYRERGYLQARFVRQHAELHPEAGTVDLYLEVREGERWEVTFEGNSLFSDNELLRRLTLYGTGFIDDEEVRGAVREIRARYEARGHYFVQVDAELGREGEVRTLRFAIEEGERSELREIRIRGLQALPEDEVLGRLGTSTWSVFGTGGYLQRPQLERDIREIETALQEAGYLSARVRRVVLVAEDRGRDLYLRIDLEEGETSLVQEVSFEGLEVEEARARRRLRLRAGMPFGPERLAADQAALMQLHYPLGFLDVEVTSECVTESGDAVPCLPAPLPAECRLSLDRDSAVACQRVERGGTVVEECRLVRDAPQCLRLAEEAHGDLVVRHRVLLGERGRFGESFVRGNWVTRRSVIRRELRFAEGEPYDFSRVLQSQSSIRSLGVFNSVRMEPVLSPEGADGEEARSASVLVQLEEPAYQSIDYRVGLESRVASVSDLLLIQSNELTWRHLNFGGRAGELRLFGSFDLDLLDPARLGEKEFDARASMVYFHPRFRWLGFRQEPLESRTELFYVYDLLAPPPNPLRREVGVEQRFRREFERVRGLSLQLGIGVRYPETLDQGDVELIGRRFERVLILALTPRVTFDRRDNPLNPRRGWFSETSMELAALALASDERSDGFTKFQQRTSAFLPIGDRFVLGLNTRLGATSGGLFSGFQRDSGQFQLPLSERFSLGGVNSLRGFGEGAIQVPGSREFGGDFLVGGNIELRYPFLPRQSLDAAVFFDTGQLARVPTDFRVRDFRSSTGVGIRLLIADLIPLVLDFGLPLDRRFGERAARVHFNVGYTF